MAETQQQQWSRLPRDILITIAKCLNKTSGGVAARVDTLRLRSVCKSWRSSIPTFKQQQDIIYFPLNLPFPISPNPKHNLSGHFTLSENTIYFLQPTQSYSSSESSSPSLPWLFRVEEKDAEKGKWKPLNPLSKVSTDSVPKWFPKSLNLLHFRISQIGVAYSIRFVDDKEGEDWTKMRIMTLIEQSNWTKSQPTSNLRVDATLAEEFKSTLVLRVAVSSSPWSGDDYAVMAIHNQGKLGFFKLGDDKWIPISDESKYHDVVHHRGKFYAVDYQGGAVVIDSDLKAKQTVPPLPGHGRGIRGGQFKYLVKSGDGHLYLVDYYPGSKSVVHLEVYKLNETNNEWERVNHLNDQVFFVGDDCCYSVSTHDFPALKGNCIYFPIKCYNIYGEEDFADGVQNLENGICGPVEVFQPDYIPMFMLPNWLKPKRSASKK